MSTCQRLAADPATAGFIGTPTLFFSHAWLQKFLNNVDALRAFVAARPEGSPEAFFWYDCFAIDQHECQYPDPAKPKKSSEWWSSTFLQAIGSIGSTIMMMSPCNGPTPLQRSWCLWELYCTAATGSELSICLGPADEAALERRCSRTQTCCWTASRPSTWRALRRAGARTRSASWRPSARCPAVRPG